MKKSARLLGKEVGLTSQEMNRVLFKRGFLSGEMGSYYTTDKAQPYVHEQDYHRGVGGYERFNRYWTTRSYDESILDELDITPELIDEVRAELSEIRKSRSITLDDSVNELMTTNSNNSDNSILETAKDAQNDNEFDTKLAVALGTIIIAGITCVIYRIVNKFFNSRNNCEEEMANDEIDEKGENHSIINRPLIVVSSKNADRKLILNNRNIANEYKMPKGFQITSKR